MNQPRCLALTLNNRYLLNETQLFQVNQKFWKLLFMLPKSKNVPTRQAINVNRSKKKKCVFQSKLKFLANFWRTIRNSGIPNHFDLQYVYHVKLDADHDSSNARSENGVAAVVRNSGPLPTAEKEHYSRHMISGQGMGSLFFRVLNTTIRMWPPEFGHFHIFSFS